MKEHCHDRENQHLQKNWKRGYECRGLANLISLALPSSDLHGTPGCSTPEMLRCMCPGPVLKEINTAQAPACILISPALMPPRVGNLEQQLLLESE